MVEISKNCPSNKLCFPKCFYMRLDPFGGGERLFCILYGDEPLIILRDEIDMSAAPCGECTVPVELSRTNKPCLYLVPVILKRGKNFVPSFSCRWFFRLGGGNITASVPELCGGCPHWFPRPPHEGMVPSMKEWARRVKEEYHGLLASGEVRDKG